MDETHPAQASDWIGLGCHTCDAGAAIDVSYGQQEDFLDGHAS
ncbi:MAG: hypothetical protein PVI09_04060 [Anaerolineae bacterium]|jgi:hypothetical protein